MTQLILMHDGVATRAAALIQSCSTVGRQDTVLDSPTVSAVYAVPHRLPTALLEQNCVQMRFVCPDPKPAAFRRELAP